MRVRQEPSELRLNGEAQIQILNGFYYRYLYKIPWPQLVGGGNSQQQKMAPQTPTGTGIPKANNNNNNISKLT